MKGRSPAFQLYANDWLSSTKIALMTPAQEGGYLRLLCHAWNDPDCSIPDDDQELSVLSRLGEGWFNGGSVIVRRCFEPHPNKAGRLVNVRLLEERRKQDEWRQKSSQGGKKSGESRAKVKDGSDLVKTKGGSRMVGGRLQPTFNQKATLLSSSSSSNSSCCSSVVAGSLSGPNDDFDSLPIESSIALAIARTQGLANVPSDEFGALINELAESFAQTGITAQEVSDYENEFRRRKVNAGKPGYLLTIPILRKDVPAWVRARRFHPTSDVIQHPSSAKPRYKCARCEDRQIIGTPTGPKECECFKEEHESRHRA